MYNKARAFYVIPHEASLLLLQFGYVVYRTVLGYYSGDESEDALDMRKALPRDVHRRSVVPLKKPIHPWQLEHD